MPKSSNNRKKSTRRVTREQQVQKSLHATVLTAPWTTPMLEFLDSSSGRWMHHMYFEAFRKASSWPSPALHCIFKADGQTWSYGERNVVWPCTGFTNRFEIYSRLLAHTKDNNADFGVIFLPPPESVSLDFPVVLICDKDGNMAGCVFENDQILLFSINNILVDGMVEVWLRADHKFHADLFKEEAKVLYQRITDGPQKASAQLVELLANGIADSASILANWETEVGLGDMVQLKELIYSEFPYRSISFKALATKVIEQMSTSEPATTTVANIEKSISEAAKTIANWSATTYLRLGIYLKSIASAEEERTVLQASQESELRRKLQEKRDSDISELRLFYERKLSELQTSLSAALSDAPKPEPAKPVRQSFRRSLDQLFEAL